MPQITYPTKAIGDLFRATEANEIKEVVNAKMDRPNGLISGGVITVGSYGGSGTNNDIRVTAGDYYIAPNFYVFSQTPASSPWLDITLCSGGTYRYIEIVGNSLGQIIRRDGNESTIPVHPTINTNEVSLGWILVGDAVIEEPAIIADSLTKKFEGFGILTGSFTLDCDSNDFPIFFFKLNGTTATLSFTNDWNVVEGTVFIEVSSTTTLNLPNISNENGVTITSKSLTSGKYKATFAALYGTYYWYFGIDGGGSLTQASQSQVEAAFDNTDQTTPVVLEQTSALTPFNAWWLVQKIKAFFSTTANQTDSTNKRFVTDANLTTIGSQSGTNTGDETTSSIQTKRPLKTINSQSLEGSGNLVISTTVSDGDKGDITVSGSGTTYTIDPNVVSNSNLAQMAASTIKANNTGSTANASDITTDQFTAMMEIAVSVNTGSVITSLISATYKYIRLTGCTGLGTILAPSTTSYKDLYIWNDTGNTITLYHNYATDANSILCGANRSWANNTMLHLKYDAIENRWCTVAQDGNTFRALLAGSGTRIVQADSTGQEQAVITTLDIDFTGAQQTSATTATWTGVNEVNISGLQQGQLYIDVSGGYRYECHRNDYCSRTPVINVETFTTNSIYPIFEITGTSGTFAEDSAYVLNNASLVTMSLPSTGTQGKVIVVNGKGAGGWKITVPNTQQIVGGATNTTTAGSGYIEATGGTKQYAAVTLKCITGGTSAVWEIVCINPATTLTIA